MEDNENHDQQNDSGDEDDYFNIMATFSKQKKALEPNVYKKRQIEYKTATKTEYNPINANYIGPMKPPTPDGSDDHHSSDDSVPNSPKPKSAQSQNSSSNSSRTQPEDHDWTALGIPISHEAV